MSLSGYILGPGEGRKFVSGTTVYQAKVESGIADFSAFEQVSEPTRAPVPAHIHDADDEAFYVMAGVIECWVGNQHRLCEPGSWVFIPRGTSHRFGVPGPGAARMLVVGSPGIQRLVEEVAPLVVAQPPDVQAVAAAFARHRSRLARQGS